MHLLNTLIIGAGPCGLAVAARLKEHTPSAIFTDEEHQRYHWINKHRGKRKMTLVRAHRGKIRGVGVRQHRDRDGDWDRDGGRRVSSSSSSSSISALSLAYSDDGAGGGVGAGLTTPASSVSGRESSPETDTQEEQEEGGGEEGGEEQSLLILDSTSSTWLSRWNTAFKTLEIEQLRSPMFFHVDPGDRDGMLAYTQEHGREGDLWEISGCVGKEVSKHKRKKKRMLKMKAGMGRGGNGGVIGETEIDERDRKDYFSPSTGLFADFCASVVARYGLDRRGLIRKCEVVDIQYDFFDEVGGGGENGRVFMVKTRDGQTFYARAVVLAVGPGRRKIYPFALEGDELEGACHSSEIKTFPSPNVRMKMQQRRETNVVVVGGGLSSAQIVDMAIRRGVRRVWFVLRSDFKVKHFDIDLNWMGKFKNYEKAVFWSADTDEERMEMIKTARNGGSITPRYQKILKEHVASGRLSIHTRTVIREKAYCSVSKTWKLVTDPPIPGLPEIDYIYFATGMHMDVRELPILQQMHSDFPIESIQGLPRITDDLMWREDVPLFLTGRLAALRLGPGAPNLEGARLGAERVAWGMEEVLGKGRIGERDGDAVGLDRSKECFCGLGNRYAELAEV